MRCLLVIAASLLYAEAQDFRPVFAVFHALESQGSEPFWTSRAKIDVDSITSLAASASMDENPLTPEDERKLENLIASGKVYKVKVIDTASGTEVVAYTPSSDPMHQTLKLSLDQSGLLEAASFIPGPSKKRVVIDVMQVATQPETATYISRMEGEKREKEKQQGQDNRSFLAKYWMYIVPLVIFVLISSNANPEG